VAALVEVFLSIHTRQALRRGSFPAVAGTSLLPSSAHRHLNDYFTPLTWTKDPDATV
jgi:hypothetical protein